MPGPSKRIWGPLAPLCSPPSAQATERLLHAELVNSVITDLCDETPVEAGGLIVRKGGLGPLQEVTAQSVSDRYNKYRRRFEKQSLQGVKALLFPRRRNEGIGHFYLTVVQKTDNKDLTLTVLDSMGGGLDRLEHTS